MKVIEPLFLNDLKEAFENARGNNNKLNHLLFRLKNIKIFDPACGSGNFLIIAYKELRRLEMEIFKEMGSLALSEISLNQFYGIELDDFAHEIAILALWLTKHQMNVEFFKEFGRTTPTLPLTDAGNIVQGNACRIDWEEVCTKGENDEIYILGNPPYLGFRNWDENQKADMEFTFSQLGNVKRLDYISCWFKNGTDFIKGFNSKYAFVSTNSICQGEQVSLLWPFIFSEKQEIGFAYQPFDWSNNAKGNAGVTCVIVGVQNISKENKRLYVNNLNSSVLNISPYLLSGPSIVMYQRKIPLSKSPIMILGSSGIDGGHLMISKDEKKEFINNDSRSTKYIKPFLSGGDFLNDIERYCLWINDEDLSDAISISMIKERIDKCRDYRLSAGRDAKKGASIPHRFFYRKYKPTNSIILPRTSSGRREYLACGFLDKGTIVSNQAFVIYDAESYLFSFLSSKIHSKWMSITSGKMRHDYSYSVNLTYNTIPFPTISKQRKEELTQCTLNIIDERLKHSEKTLAQLYDPDKMPEGLKEAHHQNDLAVERCYRSTPFSSDEERLEYLFKLYEKMIQEEKDKDTLFAKEKKTRKRK
jgi:type II restriction/modification system DNA methylase subunit YeeA